MTPDREQKLPWPRRGLLRTVGEAALVGTGILLCACASLNPFSSAPPVSLPVAPPPAILPSVGGLGDTLWQFGWLSILLLLFFPAVRGPIVGLWTAIFNTLALPFLAIRDWYDAR